MYCQIFSHRAKRRLYSRPWYYGNRSMIVNTWCSRCSPATRTTECLFSGILRNRKMMTLADLSCRQRRISVDRVGRVNPGRSATQFSKYYLGTSCYHDCSTVAPLAWRSPTVQSVTGQAVSWVPWQHGRFVDDFSAPHSKKGFLSVEVIPIYGIRNLNVLKRPHSNLALTGFVESAMTQMLANLLG